jgi:hypothetical protein
MTGIMIGYNLSKLLNGWYGTMLYIVSGTMEYAPLQSQIFQ